SASPRPASPVYGRAYSPRFPRGHVLDPEFVRWYCLGDELGAGGYGFVMTAIHRLAGHEVAVKFIIKDKVPEHAWMTDAHGKSVPTEALLLGLLDHPNIVRCLDLYEDELYFYLVQELHGAPWVAKTKVPLHESSSHASTPSLTPSPSIASEMPPTPPPESPAPSRIASGMSSASSPVARPPSEPLKAEQSPALLDAIRPSFHRRPSHDLFECIEQSAQKRLSEAQARFVFAQVVEAVAYLDAQGVTHCDIKDENILVDERLNVKLVDFGSAVVVDPAEARPHYTVFFGTTAYAASEVLLKKPYRAPPAEVWTLGVLLSYLLTGASPFPTERDAIQGRVVLHEKDGPGTCVSEVAEDLMLRCLEPHPGDRATIADVRNHTWLRGAFDL
ncbi:kinase-like protein, partial [Vararia minispora EC-137]